MFKISRQVDYALQFVLELSKLENGAFLSLRIFSKKSSISFLFLQKIAKLLREAGIVEATKGKNGGYCLYKPAGRISIVEVVEAVEGPCGATECSKLGGCCGQAGKCGVKKGIAKINKKIIDFLKKTTIKSFIN